MPGGARHRQMTSTTAHRIAGRRLPSRGNHAATDVFWLSTVPIFLQPSMRAANPAGVAARQIRGDDRFIDLRHPPLIARDERRRPLLRAGVLKEDGSWQRERDRSRRSCQTLIRYIRAAVSWNIAARSEAE